MSPEEKNQHLAEYAKISKQKAIELYGPDSTMFLQIAKNIANADNKQDVSQNLMFAANASVGAIGDLDAIDQNVAMDVKAVDETFSGYEIKTIVEVFTSPEGVAFKNRANALRTQYVLDAIANPGPKRKVLFEAYKKNMEHESIKLAPAFNTPFGRDALRKWNKYLSRKKSYQTAYQKQAQPLTLERFVHRVKASGQSTQPAALLAP